MIKVKDLGINSIPMTMQPPAMGVGGGGQDADPQTCGTCTNCTDATCTGTPMCVPHSEGGKPGCGQHSHRDKQHARGLTHEAVAQLKAQLQNHIGNELVG